MRRRMLYRILNFVQVIKLSIVELQGYPVNLAKLLNSLARTEQEALVLFRLLCLLYKTILLK